MGLDDDAKADFGNLPAKEPGQCRGHGHRSGLHHGGLARLVLQLDVGDAGSRKHARIAGHIVFKPGHAVPGSKWRQMQGCDDQRIGGEDGV